MVSEWVKSLSRVWLFVTPWTVDCQGPLSMGFPGKNTGVGYFLLQAIFLAQGLNPGLPQYRQTLLSESWGRHDEHSPNNLKTS